MDRKANLAGLVTHSPIESLALVQTLHFRANPANADYLKKEFEQLVRGATELQDVYVHCSPRAVEILGGANITTLSLNQLVLDETSGHIYLPQLVHLALCDCQRFKLSQLSVPKLKHLVLIRSFVYRRFFTSEEVLFLNRIAPTLVSLTNDVESSASLPPSIFSSSISILFRTKWNHRVPSDLPRSGSVLITLPSAEDKNAQHLSASERAKLQDWTNLISTSEHQLEAVYLALYYEGGEGNKINPAIEEAVNDLVITCQQQGISISREEQDVYGSTFADFVPASFVKRSEACHAEAHRV